MLQLVISLIECPNWVKCGFIMVYEAITILSYWHIYYWGSSTMFIAWSEWCYIYQGWYKVIFIKMKGFDNSQYFQDLYCLCSRYTVTLTYSVMLHSGVSSHFLMSMLMPLHCFVSRGQPSAEQLLRLKEWPNEYQGSHSCHGPIFTSVMCTSKSDILNKVLFYQSVIGSRVRRSRVCRKKRPWKKGT